jgi:hypothetical protein
LPVQRSGEFIELRRFGQTAQTQPLDFSSDDARDRVRVDI